MYQRRNLIDYLKEREAEVMEDYFLQENEAVLYKGRASFESGNIRNTSEILLTNSTFPH